MTYGRDVLLFDLGGVLVDVAPVDMALASLGLAPEPNVVARLAALECWSRHETGAIDSQLFAEQLIAELALELDAERVLTEFEAWNLGFLAGAVETLAELRGRHRLAVLSNTNEVHWKRLSGEMGIPGLVEVAFASHLIGLRKPDERVYRHVAAELGVGVADLVFFDDNPANIEAARGLGMRAWQVEGIASLRERLDALGYL
jgi:putative hydrolase of the HAD superfamily